MRRVLRTFLVIAWCVPAAYAQDAAPVVLTPEDAIARAIAHSQRLAEAEARKEGAQAAVESDVRRSVHRLESARATREPITWTSSLYRSPSACRV